jgi:cell shape-determining protein MreD
MNSKLTRTAAVLAFIIGAMAIFAGGQVLLGKVMDYYVIDWLPIYNFTLGLISAGFTAIIIWKGSKIAMLAVWATIASHATVMLILQTTYRDVVAPDSSKAMIVRLAIWSIILTLMLIQARKTKNTSN